GLTAQTQNIVYVDGDNNSMTGGGNAFPFGAGGGIRYQAIFPHSLFGAAPLNIVSIRDILVAGNTSDLEAGYNDIEIKMGKTTLADVGSDWNANNPNPTTVYRGPLRIRFINNQWTAIGLPNPYLYLPTSPTQNLCIEVIVWSAINSSSTNFYYPK